MSLKMDKRKEAILNEMVDELDNLQTEYRRDVRLALKRYEEKLKQFEGEFAGVQVANKEGL